VWAQRTRPSGARPIKHRIELGGHTGPVDLVVAVGGNVTGLCLPQARMLTYT